MQVGYTINRIKHTHMRIEVAVGRKARAVRGEQERASERERAQLLINNKKAVRICIANPPPSLSYVASLTLQTGIQLSLWMKQSDLAVYVHELTLRDETKQFCIDHWSLIIDQLINWMFKPESAIWLIAYVTLRLRYDVTFSCLAGAHSRALRLYLCVWVCAHTTHKLEL